MSTPLFLAIAILALTPPTTAAAIIVFDNRPPRLRCTAALGICVLLFSFAFSCLGVASALLDGRQPFFPYLVITGLPTAVVIKLMIVQFDTHEKTNIPNAPWDILG